MALPFFNWSRTASSNATADSTVTWAEGQLPSTVNDSARAMMASTAAYRDDIAGAITTGGSATAYTVTSFQVFDTLAHLNGQNIAFVPHATNTNAVGVDVTLNVDGLGAKSVRMQPSIALPNNSLVIGTPYIVTYNNSDGVFYLQNMTNPYSVPLAGGLDYWGTTAPNSSFAFPIGQLLSRTTYATLFTALGTTWGAGDGSTTFQLPDKRGRVSAAVDNMGGSSAGRFTPALGLAIGEQNHTLALGELPAHAHSGTTGTESANHTHSGLLSGTNTTSGSLSSSGGVSQQYVAQSTSGSTGIESATHTHSFTTDNGNGGGAAFNVTQPTITCNYILRII